MRTRLQESVDDLLDKRSADTPARLQDVLTLVEAISDEIDRVESVISNTTKDGGYENWAGTPNQPAQDAAQDWADK